MPLTELYNSKLKFVFLLNALLVHFQHLIKKTLVKYPVITLQLEHFFF